MATTLYRIIKYGFKNFWRQRFISLATLTVILLAVLVFQGLIIFNSLSNTVLEKLRDKVDISVYFKEDVHEDDILGIKRSLENLEDVKEVEYISRDEALRLFQERHMDDETITRAIEVLEGNVLPASLNIKAHDPSEFSTIVTYFDSGSAEGVIDSISYNENQVVIDKLASIIKTSEAAGILLTFVLSIVAVIVAFNTLLLAIYSNREEITIMRLVGASNSFIRGPFIVEGIIYGVVATITAFIISLPIAYIVSPFIRAISQDIDLWAYFMTNGFALFGWSLLFGVSIGVISSVIAIRRYIRI